MNEIILTAVLVFSLFFGDYLWAKEQQKTPQADAKMSAKVETKNLSLLKADILDKKTELHLFRFTRDDSHIPATPADQKKVTRSFKSLEGAPVATEEVYYSSDKLQKIIFQQHQLREEGSLEIKEGKIYFQYTKEGKTKKDDEKFDPDLTAVDQIHPKLNKHWKELMDGKTISIRLPVLDRLETVGFKFFKEPDTILRKKEVVVIKMKPSSFVIAALVDPLLFYFDKTPSANGEHKLLEVVGRTVPKVKEGTKWKNLDAILRFE
ncbi:MAG: hypothetical protein AB7F59_05445 [Bdellovibrionales bacterium]